MESIPCTKEELHNEVETAVEHVFDEKFDSRLEAGLKLILGKITFRMGVSVVVVISTVAIAWANLNNRVDNNDDAINEGGRFTQEEADVYREEVDRRFQQLEKALDEMKQDVKYIRNNI